MTSQTWWSVWVVDLPALAFMGGAVTLYVRGAARRRELGRARPRASGAFAAGCAVVVLAQVSPGGAWSGELLWVHMVQHLLLVVVAAPLIASGSTAATIRLALPPRVRHAVARATRAAKRIGRRVSSPPPVVLATIAHVTALWAWHAPPLYDSAATSAAAHLLEHATFLGTAVWLWSTLVATARRTVRVQAVATVCLGVLIAQGGVLGALLAFAGRSVYATYDGVAGLSALEDQQFAGALMWVPPSFVYATVAVRRFMAWLEGSERDLARRESRYRDAPSAAGTVPTARPPSTQP